MNFLKGRISAGGTTFEMPSRSVPLNAYKFTGPASAVEEGVLGIRPEHVIVGDDAQRMPVQIDVEIEIVEPMGSETVGYTNIDGQPVTFRCSSDIPLQAGQKVTIGFDPARGSIFDEKSGDRI
jgi:multiple sugar transport system ATP-binding protein